MAAVDVLYQAAALELALANLQRIAEQIRDRNCLPTTSVGGWLAEQASDARDGLAALLQLVESEQAKSRADFEGSQRRLNAALAKIDILAPPFGGVRVVRTSASPNIPQDDAFPTPPFNPELAGIDWGRELAGPGEDNVVRLPVAHRRPELWPSLTTEARHD